MPVLLLIGLGLIPLLQWLIIPPNRYLVRAFRRGATLFDKLAENIFAIVKLASMCLWLNAYESST